MLNNVGTNLLLLSTARGAELGVGVKDYRVILVFETEQALAKFIDSGWAGEAQADAAAKAGKSGAAYSGATQVAPGV